MGSFNLDIVTPIRELRVGIVSYARCPGIDGQFGIMNNHREGIFALSVGELKITQNGKDEYFATGGGFAEIIDNSVKLLVATNDASISYKQKCDLILKFLLSSFLLSLDKTALQDINLQKKQLLDK